VSLAPETFTIETRTLAGRPLRIREMELRDILGIHACALSPDFRMPYLLGTPDPVKRPVRPWQRSIDYVLKAIVSRWLGRALFGARRHWIMAIEDANNGDFIGVAGLGAVVRFPPARQRRLNRFFIEEHKSKEGPVGDAEWGFFLNSAYWRQGISMQALYALTNVLANTPSWCAPDGPIVRRLWAATGANNLGARGLLEKAGLICVPELTIEAGNSPRFEPDGTPVELVHYAQSELHALEDPAVPVRALLRRLEKAGMVSLEICARKSLTLNR
jgi:RimJ/RimL family protein N-acetyltransferase